VLLSFGNLFFRSTLGFIDFLVVTQWSDSFNYAFQALIVPVLG